MLRLFMEGNVISDLSENIRKTFVRDFDMSFFRNVENYMLFLRIISVLAILYQEELVRLRLDRLRLEEERFF